MTSHDEIIEKNIIIQQKIEAHQEKIKAIQSKIDNLQLQYDNNKKIIDDHSSDIFSKKILRKLPESSFKKIITGIKIFPKKKNLYLYDYDGIPGDIVEVESYHIKLDNDSMRIKLMKKLGKFDNDEYYSDPSDVIDAHSEDYDEIIKPKNRPYQTFDQKYILLLNDTICHFDTTTITVNNGIKHRIDYLLALNDIKLSNQKNCDTLMEALSIIVTHCNSFGKKIKFTYVFTYDNIKDDTNDDTEYACIQYYHKFIFLWLKSHLSPVVAQKYFFQIDNILIFTTNTIKN